MTDLKDDEIIADALKDIKTEKIKPKNEKDYLDGIIKREIPQGYTKRAQEKNSKPKGPVEPSY